MSCHKPRYLGLTSRLEHICVKLSTAVLRAATIKGEYHRQLVMMSDGGTLGLDWWQGSGDTSKYGDSYTPIFLVIHGVNGERLYAEGAAMEYVAIE